MSRLTRYRLALVAILMAMAGIGGATGYSIGVESAPKAEIETITLDVPPACEGIRAAIQNERARAKSVSAAALAAEKESAGRYDAELTRNEDTIAEAARLLDTANRDVQSAELELGDAVVATDAVVNKCTPERPE